MEGPTDEFNLYNAAIPERFAHHTARFAIEKLAAKYAKTEKGKEVMRVS